jgi:hypothetical protein
MSERQAALPNRQTPFSDAFRAFIGQGWAPHPAELPARLPAAGPAERRRQAISRQFPGDRLVIPAGGLKVRSNDTDYRYRPHSAFAHLTIPRIPGITLTLGLGLVHIPLRSATHRLTLLAQSSRLAPL